MSNLPKIIFAGTHPVAVPTLQALIESPYPIIGVFTQPDRAAGRGQKLTMSPIKELALKYQLPLFQPVTLRDETIQTQLRALQPDLMVVMGYGLLLPKAVLTIPRWGCINPHVSLLPRWRGASPVQRAILAGDAMTGVTIIQMNEGMDSGDMLNKISCPIHDTDTSDTLHQRLAGLASSLVLTTVAALLQNQLHPQAQDPNQVTLAPKIEKSEAKINWNMSAVTIERQVRAFNSWPVAFSDYRNQTIRIWRALSEKLTATSAQPGTIVAVEKSGISVACGEGVLNIIELQLPGGKKLLVSDFLNAKKDFFQVGETFLN